MRALLDKFGKLSQKQSENLINKSPCLYYKSPAPSSPITATKAIQTDFPVEMLESYVVKKKRIFALLNIPHNSVSSVCSVPCKIKKIDQFDCLKSWNTFPNDACNNVRMTSQSPHRKKKDVRTVLKHTGTQERIFSQTTMPFMLEKDVAKETSPNKPDLLPILVMVLPAVL